MTRLDDYPAPTVAVDLAILTVVDGGLRVFLLHRQSGEVPGWAMPGGIVHIDASPEQTVARVLEEKTGIASAHFEQLATYGEVGRDPRRRVISIAYLALCPAAEVLAGLEGHAGRVLARIKTAWSGEEGGPVVVTGPQGAVLDLAFDHNAILGDVVKRLRGKLEYSDITFALLPERFTLLEVQKVHEAILGRSLTKPAFRRKLLDRGRIRATGMFEKGGAFRPAELYEVKKER
jgi:8-oxo-dGTP diphosphatase